MGARGRSAEVGQEAELVGPAEEPAPADGTTFEVIEEVLQAEGRRALGNAQDTGRLGVAGYTAWMVSVALGACLPPEWSARGRPAR